MTSFIAHTSASLSDTVGNLFAQLPAPVATISAWDGRSAGKPVLLSGLMPLDDIGSSVMVIAPTSEQTKAILQANASVRLAVLAEQQVGQLRDLSNDSSSADTIFADCLGWLMCSVTDVYPSDSAVAAVLTPESGKIANDARPLLRFQGGYGGLSPMHLSGAATPGMEFAQRLAELAREPIELIAREIGAECTVVGLRDDHEVALAVSNYSPTARGSQVGENFPTVPPIGVLFVNSPNNQLPVEHWLSLTRLADTGDHSVWHADALERLDRAQTRGWSIMVGGEVSPAALDELTAAETPFSSDAARVEVLAQTVKRLAYAHEPADILPHEVYDVHALSVPVRIDGSVIVTLRLIGLPPQVAGSEIYFWISLLQHAATTIESAHNA